MFNARLEGLFGEVRVRVVCSEPVRRIAGLLIFALGEWGMATGVDDEFDVVGTRNRFP